MGAEQLFPMVVLVGLCIVTAISLVVVSSIFGPRRLNSKAKFEIFECGVPMLDSARRRFGVKFYVVALIFLLFDIEAVFLIPWAVVYKEVGMVGLIETLVFVAILGLGLLYIYKRGALEWE